MELTAKKMALELVAKFGSLLPFYNPKDHLFKSKQCALIAVDEILIAIDWHQFEVPNEQIDYWEQVKTEINNL